MRMRYALEHNTPAGHPAPMTRRIRRGCTGVLAAASLAGLGLVVQTDLGAADNAGVISGTVRSAKGPEAGVWVIAETDDLQTKFRKIVVTDDRGRYLLPELPKTASYRVWVRGYGLTDSTPVTSRPDVELNLAAVLARTPQEAAQIYPASYWASLIEPPKASEFPGTGQAGNGLNTALKTQSDFISIIKSCERCHQLGTKITREIPDRDKFPSSVAAWDHRVQMGQRGAEMSAFMTRMGRQRGLKMFADWSDRIAAGEVPEAPRRPRGIERNVVITMWNWGDQYGLVHDEISTDRRNPRLYPNGPVYAVDWTNDWFLIADPVTHTTRRIKVPLRADRSTMGGLRTTGFQPFRFFGSQAVWDNPAGPHNPMFDAQGRVWITTTIRGTDNPPYCREGSNRFAQYYPLARSFKQAGYYDPKTEKFTLIDTCFGTHHLMFAEDADNTLYFSDPGGTAVGWINANMYDRTGDEQQSQGWCPTVIDTNGDGRITKPWNEPVSGRAAAGEGAAAPKAAAFDPALDTRINVGAYGIITNPIDHTLWGATDEVEVPGQIFRLDRGDNPPLTCRTERYMLPKELGYRPRGIDIDRNGVIWTALAGSAHLASFDRRKCKTLSGPKTIDGRHCDEGWTFYKQPGPSYKGTDVGSEFNYYNWVDQFGTLGLGPNVPIANGSGSDSLLAFRPDSKEFVVLRVPYPLGFHSRGVDGRIDDPSGGWKGRGIYSTYGADAAWHVEGGPVERGNLVKFQIRPDPLAR
jgi:hypothetical protein